MRKRNMNMHRKIVITTFIMAAILFVMAAATSFLLSVHTMNEERAQQISNLKQRVQSNVTAMFEQAEKVALLVSENNGLIEYIDNTVAVTSEQQFAKNDYIESTLRGMIISYPYIETISLSSRNGDTYVFSFVSIFNTTLIRNLNIFNHAEYIAGLDAEEGRWRAPLSELTTSTSTSTHPYFERVLADQFVYTKMVNEDKAVTITISQEALEESLSDNESGFTYTFSGEQWHLDEVVDPANLALGKRFASIEVMKEDPEYEHLIRENMKVLVAGVFVLLILVAITSTWFASKVVVPFEWMKRQVTDIEQSQDTKEVLHYKIKRKVPASFRLKMFVYLLSVSIVGLATIFAINLYYSNVIMQKQVQQYYFEYLYQSENSIEFNIKSAEKFSTSILLDQRLQELLEGGYENETMANELKKLFSYNHIISKNIKYLNFYNTEGEMVFSTISSLLNEQPIQQRKVYPLLENSRGETIYFNELQDPFGDHIITIAKKIRSTKNPEKLLGFYLLAVDQQELYLLDENLGINSLNLLIADRSNSIIYMKKDVHLAEQILAIYDVESDAKGMRISKIGGKDHLLLYGQLGETGWRVISTIDVNEIQQGQRTIALLFGYSLLIILALILIAIYWISKSISKPVESLVFNIREVIKEDFRLTGFRRMTGSDEVYELSEHIHAMIEKIQQLMGDIVEFEVKNREIQLQFQKAELANLMQQINPHFLYNTLDTIKWMTMELTGGDNKASLMLHELAYFLRAGIHFEVKKTSLQAEIDHARAYLYIQQVRYGDRLVVKWDIAEECKQLEVTKFLLQPTIENALIHGIDKHNKRGYLYIQAKLDESKQNLIISVVDNGVGMDRYTLAYMNGYVPFQGDAEQDDHVGLHNIRQRLKLVFGDNATMILFSKSGFWTKVVMTIPLENK